MLRFTALSVLLLASNALAIDPTHTSWRPDLSAVTRVVRVIGFLELTGGQESRLTNGVATSVFVWGEKNKRYAVYAPNGGRVNLKIPAGGWRVQFYNPRTGVWGKKTDEKADDSGLTLKFAADGDWAALVVRD